MNNYAWGVFLLTLSLFVFMLLLLEWGRRKGQRRLLRDGEKASEGDGTVNGAIFALMGLLIAFTFSGAASRFDDRRNMIVEEANAIGAAYLRLDLLQPGAQGPIKELFRKYVDSRLDIYQNFQNEELIRANIAKSNQLQGEIWRSAVSACPGEPSRPACMLLLPALNEMFDITTTRTVATITHPPVVIYAMLFLFTLAGALLAGFGMAGNKKRNWTHMVVFSATLSFAIYVILDFRVSAQGINPHQSV